MRWHGWEIDIRNARFFCGCISTTRMIRTILPEPLQNQIREGALRRRDRVRGCSGRETVAAVKAQRPSYDGTVIAVMADHGESLGAHGEDTHGIFLYDETIQVPLLIKLPLTESAGKRVDNRVELVDVMPTLLQAVGVAVPPEVQGASLLDIIKPPASETAESWRDRAAYAETDYPRIAFGFSALQSLRTGKYLFVQAPKRELYDQSADAKAEHNLASTSSAIADTLAAKIEEFRQKTSNNREAPKAAADPSAEERLAALGYVVSSGVSHAESAEHRSDPKDKVEIANLMHRANVLQEDGHFEEAVVVFQKLTVEDPEMPVYSKLGECFMRLKEYDKAVPVLRKAVEMNPDSPMEHFALAKALVPPRISKQPCLNSKA